MSKKTVSITDLLQKTQTPSGKSLIKPLSKNTIQGVTDFIRNQFAEVPSTSIKDQSLITNGYDLGDIERNKQIQLNTTEHKVKTEPKRDQNKLETKWRQTRDKVETNQEQSGDKLETKWRQTRDKVGTQLETQLETKWRQTRDKVETKLHLSSLCGLQRQVVIFLFHNIQKNQHNETEKIAIQHIAQSCETSVNSIKKTIQRLEKTGFIQRIKFKNGRGGWTTYSIPKVVFQDLLQELTRDKLETKWRQTRDKVGTQLGTQLETTSPSSSSYIYNKTTTTRTDENLEAAWKLVQIPQVLQQYQFGSHIIDQIQNREWLTAFDLQKSLDAFAFDVQENNVLKKKKINNALGYFMGTIKNGQIYAPPSNYKSDEQKALEENETRLKALQAQREREAEVLEALLFEEWFAGLTDDEKKKLVPEKEFIKIGGTAHNIQLKEHYLKNIQRQGVKSDE